MSNRLKGLYAITQDGLDSAQLLHKTEAILGGGARILQYRDKSQDSPRRQREARALQALCREHNCLFLINDDIELAVTIGADGVHLGREDASFAEARKRLGSEAIIGLSCYNQFELAQQAAAAGASYAAFGAFFPSPTKPTAKQAGLELLQRGQRELQLPLCAIGGITRGNAPLLIDAGAAMLAVISELYDSAEPEQVAGELSALFA